MRFGREVKRFGLGGVRVMRRDEERGLGVSKVSYCNQSSTAQTQRQLLKTGPAGAISYRSGRIDLPSALLTTSKHEFRYLQQMVY